MRRRPPTMENEETSLAATSPQPPKITKHITDDQECIEKILLRLPAKSLLTSQFVCRGWRDMIQEPRFKNLHFEHNSRKSEPSQLLILKEIHEDEQVMILDEDLQPSNIWMPQDLGGDWVFLGSCNGLVLIGVNKEFTVFNPATCEVVSLPRPTNIAGYGTADLVYEDMFTELVFHRATGEYKVILFYTSYPVYKLGAIFMYTLGAHSSWRYIGQAEERPTGPGVNVYLPNGPGVNVDDTVYWPYKCLSKNYKPVSFIISFDLNTEQIGKVSLPNQDKRNLVGLTTWDGKLCEASFIEERQSLGMSIFDNLHWTLRHEIQLPEVVGHFQEIPGHFRLLVPYSIISDRVFIWTDSRIYYHEISGNPDNIQEIPVENFARNKQCFAYVESLLPVPN